MSDAADETRARYGVGRQDVRRTMRTTNEVERQQEEVRRRTGVSRSVPHEAGRGGE